MSFNKDQFEDLIDEVLTEIDMYSKSAVNLLLGTAAQESGFGTYLRQLGNGPALGVFQMEPATEKDIWDNYLQFRAGIRNRIGDLTGVYWPGSLHLKGDLIYQIIMARLHYRRVPEALPSPNDIEGLAQYWKQYYNTPEGRGTIREFIHNYFKYLSRN